MNKRECLYQVQDLGVESILPKMNDNQVDEYWVKLNLYVDDLPALDEKIKDALAGKDYAAFTKELSTLRDLLKQIYANGMARDCQIQLRAITKTENIRHEKLEAYMTYFLTHASILAIDIQLAAQEIGKAPPKIKAPTPMPKETGEPKMILAVDDQAIHLNALKAHLGDSPYKLACLSSGADVLRFITKMQPDLYILDIMMPEMDGYELARRIRETGSLAPIIFLTGNSSKEIFVKAIKAGGVDFIVKPSTKDRVLERIEKFI